MTTPEPAWKLPDIPQDAVALTVLRPLSSEHAQGYDLTRPPSGRDAIVRALTSARRQGTIRLWDPLGSEPVYGLITLENAARERRLTLAIPTHEAFLSWVVQLGLRPIQPAWEPEDPHIPLLLTRQQAADIAELIRAGWRQLGPLQDRPELPASINLVSAQLTHHCIRFDAELARAHAANGTS